MRTKIAILYNIAFIIFGILYAPYFLIKAQRRRCFRQRLGLLPKDIVIKTGDSSKTVWLHACSVGEIRAGSPLINKLREKFNLRFVISTVTYTGNEIAKKIARREDAVIYLPFDISVITGKVVGRVSARAFIALETEIWPNLISSLRKSNTPIILVNGRISDNSLKRYMLVRRFLKPTLERINIFCMQSALYKERIISIGAPAANVFVTGNMKFDELPVSDEGIKEKIATLRNSLGLRDGDEFFVCGSTHKGEEEIILRAYKRLKESSANLKLLIAPRHTDRIPDIERLAESYGFSPIKISKLNRPSSLVPHPSSIFLLDTMGELKLFYGLATVVFMGGSLVRCGGHNMIEAAIFSKPIIFGTHIFNFKDVASAFLEHQAAIMIKNEKELIDVLEKLIDSPQEKTRLGKNAFGVVEKNRGATDRNIDLISKLL